MDQIAAETRELRAVLTERLDGTINALEGGFSAVSGNLWVSEDDGSAVAAALQPKLVKAQTAINTTLFEVVTLELAVTWRVDAVVLANLMPRFWAEFIRSSSDKEARSMGTVPVP